MPQPPACADCRLLRLSAPGSRCRCRQPATPTAVARADARGAATSGRRRQRAAHHARAHVRAGLGAAGECGAARGRAMACSSRARGWRKLNASIQAAPTLQPLNTACCVCKQAQRRARARCKATHVAAGAASDAYSRLPRPCLHCRQTATSQSGTSRATSGGAGRRMAACFVRGCLFGSHTDVCVLRCVRAAVHAVFCVAEQGGAGRAAAAVAARGTERCAGRHARRLSGGAAVVRRRGGLVTAGAMTDRLRARQCPQRAATCRLSRAQSVASRSRVRVGCCVNRSRQRRRVAMHLLASEAAAWARRAPRGGRAAPRTRASDGMTPFSGW